MRNKTTSILLELNEEELCQIIRQYHLKEEDIKILLYLMDILTKKMECQICYQLEEEKGFGIITLGNEIDGLQEYYHKKEMLYETFLLEYLGIELLNKAYQKFNDICKKETGQYIKQFLFPGAELPLSDLKSICEKCHQNIVSYNSAFALLPKKSTVFQVLLTNEQEEHFCHVCTGCGNKECSMRRKEVLVPTDQKENLNYGYQRIFGKK